MLKTTVLLLSTDLSDMGTDTNFVAVERKYNVTIS